MSKKEIQEIINGRMELMKNDYEHLSHKFHVGSHLIRIAGFQQLKNVSKYGLYDVN